MGQRNGEDGQGEELGLLEKIWQRQKEQGGVGAEVLRRGEQNAVDDPRYTACPWDLSLSCFFSWFTCIFLNKVLMVCFYEI